MTGARYDLIVAGGELLRLVPFCSHLPTEKEPSGAAHSTDISSSGLNSDRRRGARRRSLHGANSEMRLAPALRNMSFSIFLREENNSWEMKNK